MSIVHDKICVTKIEGNPAFIPCRGSINILCLKNKGYKHLAVFRNTSYSKAIQCNLAVTQ